MDSSTPFYKQLSSRFIALFVLLGLIISLAVTMLEYRDQQIRLLIDTQPNVTRSFTEQSLYYQISQQLSRIEQSTDIKDLLTNHQQLITQLQQLKSVTRNNRRQLERLISAQLTFNKNIERLQSDHNRNQLFLQNSLIQLDLVRDELRVTQSNLQARRNKLYQQITQDKVADKVTASRAKAHANVVKFLETVNQTLNAVQNQYVMFNQLTLNYPLVDFNENSTQLFAALKLWEPQFTSKVVANEADKKLLELLGELNNILYTEQSTVGKWRGYLRIAQQYYSSITEFRQQLQGRFDKLDPPTATISFVPKLVSNYLVKNIGINERQFQWALYGIMLLLACIFCYVLVNIKQRIQKNGKQQLAVVEQAIIGESDSIQFYSEEQTNIAERISSLITPKHSEQDYQQLNNEFIEYRQHLVESAKLATFALDDEKAHFINAQQLVFGDMSQQRHWRHAFTKESAELIIQTAKQAIQKNASVTCVVKTSLNQHIQLTLWRKNETWHGVVANYDNEFELHETIDKLNEDLSAQVTNNQSLLAKSAENLSKMLIRTMLQSQSVSIGSGVTSTQVYRQLMRTFEWCRQQQISYTLPTLSHATNITQIALKEELAALHSNLAYDAYLQRNAIFMQVDPTLVTQGQVDIRLLQRMLTSLAKLSLQELFKAKLIIGVNVVDKNAGQQIICFSFEVHTNISQKTLPEHILALMNFSEGDGSSNNYQFYQYLYRVIDKLHGENVQVLERDSGFTITLHVPISLDDNLHQNDHHTRVLKDAQLMCLSDDGFMAKQLARCIGDHGGKVEIIDQLEHGIKLLNVKHLNVHKIQAVIVTPQKNKNIIKQLEQHIATLPKPLQPKTMVLQSHFNHNLSKEGFYQHSDGMIDSISFAHQLAKFVDSDLHNNLMVEPDIFANVKFAQTHVEVLVAVYQPSQHQQLARILHWLGLQVSFVCQPTSMKKHWQSGRYLLLITEMECSPYIEMQVGKNVSRAVFTLKNTVVDDSNNDDSNARNNWQTNVLPHALDIQELVKMFTPWLKQQAFSNKHNEPQVRQVSTAATNNAARANNKDKLAQLDLTPVETNDKESHFDEIAAFDLAGFAHNQGSPELAVFMLDEYLFDIHHSIEKISMALKQKDFSQATIENEALLTASAIIVANDVHAIAKQLSIALNERSLKQANSLMKKVTQANIELVEFSQAI